MNLSIKLFTVLIVILICRHEDYYADAATPIIMMDLDLDTPMENISDPPNCTTGEQQQHNRLECFLWNLRVDIPQESFEKDWITISVHDMICTNFKISGLQSSSSPSSSSSSSNNINNNNTNSNNMNSNTNRTTILKSELDISVKTIAATCQGRYHSGLLAGNVIATVSAAQQQQQNQWNNKNKNNDNEIGDTTTEALEVVFSIKGDTNTNTNTNTNSTPISASSLNNHLSATEILPKSFRTISCTTNLHCQSIKFSGSLSAKLIQAFSKTISHYITDAITGNVCPLLPKTIDPLITAYLHKFDDYIEKYLPPPSSSSEETTADNSSRTTTWNRNDNKYKNNQNYNNAPLRRRVAQNDDDLIMINSGVSVEDNIDKKKNSTSNNNTLIRNVADYHYIHSILNLLNEQLRYHLQIGWIPLPLPSPSSPSSPDCVNAFRGISGWFASMFGTRPLIRLPKHFQHLVFPIPNEIIDGGATVVLNISQLFIEGLDQMGVLQLLEPYLSSSPSVPSSHDVVTGSRNIQRTKKSKTAKTTITTLQTKLASREGFFVVVPVVLEIRLPTKSLKESFQVTINITQIDITLSSLIQVVDWESTTLLQVVDVVQKFVKSRDLHDLTCLFHTINKVEIEEWIVNNISVDMIQISRDDQKDGSLEADLDHAINTVIGLFLTDYANLWNQLVRGLVHGPGTRAVNNLIRHWIESHSTMTSTSMSKERRIGDEVRDNTTDDDGHGQCSPANLSSYVGGGEAIPKWLNFTKFKILYKFNRYLDHSHTKRTLNQFLSCLSERLQVIVGDDGYFYNNNNNDGSDGLATRSTFFGILSSGMRMVEDVVGKSGISIENLGTITKSQVPTEAKSSDKSENENLKKLVTLAGIELRHWDSLKRIEIMKPSGDTKLESSLIFGELAASKGVEDGDNKPFSLLSSNTTSESVSSSKGGPPQVTLIVDVDGYKISGKINVTFYVSLEAHAEVKIDYDLNRLENLTVSRLLEEVRCALLPAIEIGFMPRTTSLNVGKYFGVNLTAAVGGKNLSLSAQDYPQFLEISNDALHWSQEFSRTFVNYAFEKWIGSSLQKCPGVVMPEDNDNGSDHRYNPGGKTMYWLWKDSTTLWIIFGLIVVVQAGLLFISRLEIRNDEDSNDRETNISNDLHQIYRSDNAVTNSRTTPLLSSYDELMINPFSGTNECNNKPNRVNSIDAFILRDICDDSDDEDDPQVILEDQLIEPTQYEPKISIFESEKIPEVIRYLIPVMIIGTIILFISSNSSVGASVDISIQAGQHSIGIPGIFQFSLGKTVSELYHAGIYPLLILVVCFSGIWPYVKLLLMLYFWMKPCANQHQQERRLLNLDALGKLSLVDNYVLILFLVAFRFHLGVSDNLGMDVYVQPVYGFFSFLLATCISLLLGHVVLFCHRRTMRHDTSNANIVGSSKTSIINHGFKVRNENSPYRLSCVIQGLLLLAMVSTLGLLLRGFLQESFTFKIGGLAAMVDEDSSITSYSVLSLGLALPSSVESPQSLSIIFLQGTYFFFTVVTPILCLTFLIILMFVPMRLKWQRHFLVAAEITSSWSAIEVFLLSILAALFQISTFASFMIGDKCDAIEVLAKNIFDEQDVDTVCFTVDASIGTNIWFLLVGTSLNSVLVSVCLSFVENAVEEKMEDSSNERQEQSPSEAMSNATDSGRTFAQQLFELTFIGRIMFVSIPNSYSTSEEDGTALEEVLVNEQAM